MSRVLSIGECMLELSILADGGCSLSWGGDTLNTAVYLARLGVAVDYLTALGDDPFSDAMLSGWRAEGVGTSRVVRIVGMLPGLYAIRRDATGERSFYYWRQNAAARELFRHPDARETVERIVDYAWVYLSGITLSLYDDAGRDVLVRQLDRVRERGGKVVFDGNFRPRGWPDLATARAAFSTVLARTDIALPSADDERGLWGDPSITATIERLRSFGVPEIVVKDGARGCVLADQRSELMVPARPDVPVVDTTAAGDSFNAAYLAARLRGCAPPDAAARGHVLAAAVIGAIGAILPRERMPPWREARDVRV